MSTENRLIVFFAVILISIPSVLFAGDNILGDGGFENSPHKPGHGWKDYGPGTRDFDNMEQVYSGEQSCRITLSDASERWNSEIIFQEDIPDIQGDDKFEASAHVFLSESNALSKNVEVYLEIIFYDGEGKDSANELGKFQSGKCTAATRKGEWTNLRIKGRSPATSKNCKLQLVVLPLPYLDDNSKSNEKYSGTIYFDDVNFIKVK